MTPDERAAATTSVGDAAAVDEAGDQFGTAREAAASDRRDGASAKPVVGMSPPERGHTPSTSEEQIAGIIELPLHPRCEASQPLVVWHRGRSSR